MLRRGDVAGPQTVRALAAGQLVRTSPRSSHRSSHRGSPRKQAQKQRRGWAIGMPHSYFERRLLVGECAGFGVLLAAKHAGATISRHKRLPHQKLVAERCKTAGQNTPVTITNQVAPCDPPGSEIFANANSLLRGRLLAGYAGLRRYSLQCGTGQRPFLKGGTPPCLVSCRMADRATGITAAVARCASRRTGCICVSCGRVSAA